MRNLKTLGLNFSRNANVHLARKRVIGQKVSKSSLYIWESSGNFGRQSPRFGQLVAEEISAFGSSFTSHLLCFLPFVLQMLTNQQPKVHITHMIITSMPIVTILRGPTHARANQHISETETTASVSVSFKRVILQWWYKCMNETPLLAMWSLDNSCFLSTPYRGKQKIKFYFCLIQ